MQTLSSEMLTTWTKPRKALEGLDGLVCMASDVEIRFLRASGPVPG